MLVRVLLSLLACSSLALVAAEGDTPVKPTEATKGASSRPFLGVQVDAASAAADGGLKVLHVVVGSTAKTLGVKVGDIMVSINGAKLPSRAVLKETLSKITVGAPVTIVLKRDGKLTSVNGTMQAMPSPAQLRERVKRLQEANLAMAKTNEEVKQKQATLAESLQQLATVLENLPAQLDTVAREFKQVYPEGEFTVQVHIDIRTGPEDETLDIAPQPKQPGEEPEGDEAPTP